MANSPVITCCREYRRIQHVVPPKCLQSKHGRMARAVFCIESLIDASAPARISASSSLDSGAALQMLKASVSRCLCLSDGLEDIQVTTQRCIVKRCCTNLSRSNRCPCLAVCVCVCHTCNTKSAKQLHTAHDGAWWRMVLQQRSLWIIRICHYAKITNVV